MSRSLRDMLPHGWHQLHGYYTSKASRFYHIFPFARQFLRQRFHLRSFLSQNIILLGYALQFWTNRESQTPLPKSRGAAFVGDVRICVIAITSHLYEQAVVLLRHCSLFSLRNTIICGIASMPFFCLHLFQFLL